MTTNNYKFKQTEIGEIPEGWNKDELTTYLKYISSCLCNLYQNEYNLFDNNLCERCIAFRFAHLLQNIFNDTTNSIKYFVDCDYNSSFYYNKESGQWKKINGKPIEEQYNEKLTNRFIDIIVHQRKYEQPSDLICFEIKKWNNCTKKGVDKDINNLKKLTSIYGYNFGFHLIFGKKFEETKLKIVKGDKSIDYIFSKNEN